MSTLKIEHITNINRSGEDLSIDTNGNITTIGNIKADGGNLILGDEALSVDANYVGLKTSYMTGTADYMILSGTTANSIGDTFVSAKTGSNVFIRGGGNDPTHQIEIQSGQAKAHGILSVMSTALVGNADFGSYNSTHGNLMVSNGANPTSILLYNDAGAYNSSLIQYDTNVLKLGLNNANSANTLLTTSAINVTSSGVGIGTDAPDRNLHVKEITTGGTVAKFENTAGTVFIELNTNNQVGADAGYIAYDSNQDLSFWPSDSKAMTLKADGNIGIGISPATTAGVNYARLVIDADSSTYPKSLEINATNAAGPNFSISSYSDNNGSYYLLGANLQLQSNGNFAWETNGEHMAGISIDSRAGHGVTFVDSFYDSNTTAYVPAEIGKIHTSSDSRVDMIADASGITGSNDANAFFVAKAKGYYFAGLDIESSNGHTGGVTGLYPNGNAAGRAVQIHVGGTGLNAGDVVAVRANVSGNVTKPNQSGICLTLSASQGLPGSGTWNWEKINLNTVIYQNGNTSAWDSSNSRYVCPETGLYLVTTSVQMENNGGAVWRYLFPCINGATSVSNGMNFADFVPQSQPNATYYHHAHTCILKCSSGDYIEWKATGSGGGSTVKPGSETACAIYFLG